MKRIYNKLVRDNIPEIIRSSGRKANYFVLNNDKDYEKALMAKLIEESNALLLAETEEETVDELADIMTVLAILLEKYNIHSDANMERVLLSKLVDMSNQLYVADTDVEVVNGLSDIVMALSCILANHEQTVAMVHTKLAQNGGFEKRYFLESVE